MASKHEHAHDHCKHEHLAHCDICHVVHCKDCGREWQDNPAPVYVYPWYHGSGTYNPHPWYLPTVTCGDVTTGVGNVSVTNGQNGCGYTLTTTCDHVH